MCWWLGYVKVSFRVFCLIAPARPFPPSGSLTLVWCVQTPTYVGLRLCGNKENTPPQNDPLDYSSRPTIPVFSDEWAGSRRTIPLVARIARLPSPSRP